MTITTFFFMMLALTLGIWIGIGWQAATLRRLVEQRDTLQERFDALAGSYQRVVALVEQAMAEREERASSLLASEDTTS